MDDSNTHKQSKSIDRLLPRIGALLVVGSLIYGLGVPLTADGKTEKVTICHAAGQEGTDQYVTLILPYPAVFGNAGHFNENGTARAGHEGDSMGACDIETTTTSTVAPDTVPTSPETTSTTSVPETLPTVPESTTTTVQEEVTPTTQFPTTTTVPVSTTTSAPEKDDDDVAATETTPSGSDTDDATTEESSDKGDRGPEVAAVETLPYTGVDASVVIPALLMLIMGVGLIAVTSGFGLSSGAHLSTTSSRFGFGLHRGRHESRND